MKVLDLYAGTASATQPWEDRGHEVRTVELSDAFDPDHRADVAAFAESPDDWLDGWRPDVVWASPPCTAFAMAGSGSKAAWDRYQDGEAWDSDPPLSEFRWHYDQDHPFYGPRVPNDDTAREGVRLVLAALEAVRRLEPRWWWVENPMGDLRSTGFMEVLANQQDTPPNRVRFLQAAPDYVDDGLPGWVYDADADHVDVTYCQYWNPALDVEPEPRMKRTDLWGEWPDTWDPRPVCGNGEPCHAAAPRGSDTGTQALDPVDRSRVPYELGNEIARACEIAADVDR